MFDHLKPGADKAQHYDSYNLPFLFVDITYLTITLLQVNTEWSGFTRS